MRENKRLSIFVIYLMAMMIFAAACDLVIIPKDTEFQVQFPGVNWNQHLEISFEQPIEPNGFWAFAFFVRIKNISESLIRVDLVDDLRIYVYIDGEWTEIQNQVGIIANLAPTDLYPPAPYELRDQVVAIIYPNLDLYRESGKDRVDVRVAVVGEVLEGGENVGTRIGSYRDFEVPIK